jgi:hypothetical protein
MKRLKLSKVAWIILGAGVFVVVLVGLGVTMSQQMKEQTVLEEDLSISEMRMEKLELSNLFQELESLTELVDEAENELAEAKTRLDQTVNSADVVEEFFDIAQYSSIIVMDISSTPISDDSIIGVDLSTTLIKAIVIGQLDDVVSFVINLNNGLTTGYIDSVNITIPEALSEELPTANIQISVYSYEEE